MWFLPSVLMAKQLRIVIILEYNEEQVLFNQVVVIKKSNFNLNVANQFFSQQQSRDEAFGYLQEALALCETVFKFKSGISRFHIS